MKKTNKKGFTIVELVIVIAVIAILSAVLIPTFGTLITDANHSAAQQKARNAYTAYIQEYSQNATLLDADLVIEADGFYFSVTKGQLADVEGDADLTGYHAYAIELNESNVYIKGACADNSNPADDECDICGATIQ